MARYTGAVCRLCRREGTKLFLKGTKCLSDRCPIEKRNFPPGQHGKDRKAKIVGYGLQLHEKQKAKRMYFTLEGQFRAYYEKANRATGVTGELLIQQLERRLDNVAYRLGFAISRFGDTYRLPEMFAGIVVLAVVAVGLTSGVRRIEASVAPWRAGRR